MGYDGYLVFDVSTLEFLFTETFIMNQLKEYTEKQLQAALQMLQTFTPGADEEIIHQLRVSLKKIKAVLLFISTLHPAKAKQIRKKVQLIFRAAGSIREAQLQLQWLKKKRYLHLIKAASLEQKIKQDEELFLQQKELFHTLLTSIREDVLKQIHKIKSSAVTEYAVKLKEELHEQAIHVVKDDWHELRKLSKQLLYAHHWVSEQDKLKVMTVLSYHSIDQLQEEIGMWHDLVDMQQWLLDEQFFLSSDASVKQQDKKASEQLQKNLLLQEQAVLRQLLVIKKPANQK
jgi:CHAD domain-containing protein